VSSKNEQLSKLLKKITPRAALPKAPEGLSLLEHGLLCVLARHVAQDRAETFVAALRKAYPEWNEKRVAQTDEIAAVLKGGRTTPERLRSVWGPAREARDYLQEIFQKTHAMDLEFLRGDVPAGAKMLAQMPVFGTAATCRILALAGDNKVPAHPALVRVLERTGIVGKGNLKKAKDLEDYLPSSEGSALLERVGEVADRWCHAKSPACHECPLVDECTFGKKAFQEWKVQQARAESQRQREAARRAALEKKEQERLNREAARLAKKNDAIRQKQEREKQKRAAVEARKREAEAQKQRRIADLAKRKLEAQKAEQKRKALAEKLAAKKKAAAAAKKSGGARKSRKK
jgi:endonuclease III